MVEDKKIEKARAGPCVLTLTKLTLLSVALVHDLHKLRVACRVILNAIFDLFDINMGFHPIPGFFFCVPKRITKKRAP
jgi:hypothetical protein